MNVDLLLRVKKHIQQKPTRLRMSKWIVKKDKTSFRIDKDYFHFEMEEWNEPTKQKIPSCGTVGCIAGWSCELSSETHHGPKMAEVYLDITPMEGNRLFYVSHWPSKLEKAYYDAKNQRERAKIVGKVIDLFIKTNGTFIENDDRALEDFGVENAAE